MPRAHYLVGKDSRRMALLAELLPAPALDALRRKMLLGNARSRRAARPASADPALSPCR
jgi:hypothetical protein